MLKATSYISNLLRSINQWMKKGSKIGIWVRNRVGLGWVVAGVSGLVVGVNFFTSHSPIEAEKISVMRQLRNPAAHLKLAEKAAWLGDYRLAKEEFDLAIQLTKLPGFGEDSVLGAKADVGEVEQLKKEIFPQEAVEAEIKKLEEILEQKPRYRDVLLHLALLYWQIFEEEKAEDYYQQAFELDPNNVVVQKVGEFLEKN